MVDLKRKVARAVAVLAVAFGAGHLVQNMSKTEVPARVARTAVLPEPTAIQTVSATDTAPLPAVLPKPSMVAAATVVPAAPAAKMADAPIVLAATGATESAEPAPIPELKLPSAPLVAAPLAKPETVPAPSAPAMLADACAITLDLMVEANAMIGITLQAPCRPNQDVVLKHAGLAVSGKTTANGGLFTGIPALATNATIEVLFADGKSATAEISVPEVAQLRRFGVQWQANDAFQVHGFEGGSGYDGPGHISAANPHRPSGAATSSNGFLTLLGDASAKTPQLAEIFTFPSGAGAAAEVVVESEVTSDTCGRELLGETLNSVGGKAYVADLTLAMPDCSAIGDYMVLKNLVLDLNIAAAE